MCVNKNGEGINFMRTVMLNPIDTSFLKQGRKAVMEIRNKVPMISERGEVVHQPQGLYAKAKDFLYEQDLFTAAECV